MPIKNLSGQSFGRLTVTTKSNNIDDRVAWNCVCSCGKKAIVKSTNLVQGFTKSCGCLQIKASLKNLPKGTHGMKGTSVYSAWYSMKARCLCKTHHAYASYGGRGIAICNEWINSFESFYADMGDKPSKEHSLDRINNDGDYTPTNSRWATRTQQQSNTRTNRIIEYNGKSLNLAQWGRKMNLPKDLIGKRLSFGWSIERSLTEPVHPRKPTNR